MDEALRGNVDTTGAGNVRDGAKRKRNFAVRITKMLLIEKNNGHRLDAVPACRILGHILSDVF